MVDVAILVPAVKADGGEVAIEGEDFVPVFLNGSNGEVVKCVGGLIRLQWFHDEVVDGDGTSRVFWRTTTNVGIDGAADASFIVAFT